MRAHPKLAGRAFWLPVALLFSLTQLGADCDSPPPFLAVTTPPHGATITTPSFPLELSTHSTVDLPTLRVELNGEDITDQLAGGPALWTATLGPGAPLRDHNELLVAARSNVEPFLESSRLYTFEWLPPKARARGCERDCTEERRPRPDGPRRPLVGRVLDRPRIPPPHGLGRGAARHSVVPSACSPRSEGRRRALRTTRYFEEQVLRGRPYIRRECHLSCES